jgi:hypothetical protein
VQSGAATRSARLAVMSTSSFSRSRVTKPGRIRDPRFRTSASELMAANPWADMAMSKYIPSGLEPFSSAASSTAEESVVHG